MNGPGRSCPVSYRYAPGALAQPPEFTADCLYVIGGLYGNGPALQAILELAQAESTPPRLVFNGDFNWFNIDHPGFVDINRQVLQHTALRGNVETEMAAADTSGAGCGCAYPESVSDAEVERSNRIMEQLRTTAMAFPELMDQLAVLPMHTIAAVGGLRVGMVHGDLESLAGWNLAQEHVEGPPYLGATRAAATAAQLDIVASSHTCLPVAIDLPDGPVIVNNGAAGMPNFAGTRHGVITRIALTQGKRVLYGMRYRSVYVEALPVCYDVDMWLAQFLTNWPPGSPGHASYFTRIAQGPRYPMDRAARGSFAGVTR